MNKVSYKKTTVYKFLKFDLFKKIEFYDETSQDDLEDDTPPIEITKDYKKSEFDI